RPARSRDPPRRGTRVVPPGPPGSSHPVRTARAPDGAPGVLLRASARSREDAGWSRFRALPEN
ncbi:MAG: hypothetical protein ACRYG2_10810, partial [Janthinobacterium lividum]